MESEGFGVKKVRLSMKETPKKPVVAIVGRPNVGKSRLFNRLIGRNRAIVQDRAGVTRDRLYGEVSWRGRTFCVIDMGGVPGKTKTEMTTAVQKQIDQALQEADLFCFVVDRKEGLHPVDEEIAKRLRCLGKPIVLVVNKVDVAAHESILPDFYRLGIEPMHAISAEGGRGVDLLLDTVVQTLALSPLPERTGSQFSIAILGRPNVGKSSLFNRLLQEERSVVTSTPGTTRDPVDSEISIGDQSFRLVDTAGVRRKSRVRDELERITVQKALHDTERSDLLWLVIDASEGVVEQELRLARLIDKRYQPMLIVLNKIDEVPIKEQRKMMEGVRYAFRFLPQATIQPVSARTGAGLEHLIPKTKRLRRLSEKRIPTPILNRFAEVDLKRISISYRGFQPNLRYLTQIGVAPPTFVLFFDRSDRLTETHRRFFKNELQRGLGFQEIPIRLLFRTGR